MNNGGDAAEQVVRLSLEGFEVAAKLTGSAAKNVALLLVSVLKQEQQTKGKARLTNMIKSGKELKVFSIPNKDLAQFTKQAKRYGVLYCVLRDKSAKGDDVPVDIIARAEDASKIQRIVERFEIGKVDKAGVITQAEQDKADREAVAREVPTKTKGEIIVEEAMGKPLQKEGQSHENPTVELCYTLFIFVQKQGDFFEDQCPFLSGGFRSACPRPGLLGRCRVCLDLPRGVDGSMRYGSGSL